MNNDISSKRQLGETKKLVLSLTERQWIAFDSLSMSVGSLVRHLLASKSKVSIFDSSDFSGKTIPRGVSLTLADSHWVEINKSGLSTSVFVKLLLCGNIDNNNSVIITRADTKLRLVPEKAFVTSLEEILGTKIRVIHETEGGFTSYVRSYSEAVTTMHDKKTEDFEVYDKSGNRLKYEAIFVSLTDDLVDGKLNIELDETLYLRLDDSSFKEIRGCEILC